MKDLIPVLVLALLCAAWVLVQLLARHMNTKNHFDDLDSSSCGRCSCGGVPGQCRNELIEK